MNPVLSQLEASLLRELHNRKKPGDVDLGLGEPLLPVDLQAFHSALDWVASRGCPYSPNPGFPELRARIAAVEGRPGLDTPEQVCVTVGSEEAIYLALRAAVDPAEDEVLVVEPAYTVYTKICRLEGIRCRTVSLSEADGFTPRAAAVLEALRPDTRTLVLSSPVNPSGRIWPREELQLLAEGLLKRPGRPIQVISDEVYRSLYYTPDPPTSIAELYPHTWVANSLSKSHALTGLRIGWLLAPREAIAGVIKIHHYVVTSPGTFDQRVALYHFERPESFQAHRSIYQARRALLLDALQQARLQHVPPDGAFYCLVKLEGKAAEDSLASCIRLVEEAQVVCIPGKAFGRCVEGWIRLSWVAEPLVVAEGIRRVRDWLDR